MFLAVSYSSTFSSTPVAAAPLQRRDAAWCLNPEADTRWGCSPENQHASSHDHSVTSKWSKEKIEQEGKHALDTMPIGSADIAAWGKWLKDEAAIYTGAAAGTPQEG
eukprot:Pgem_evm1s13595